MIILIFLFLGIDIVSKLLVTKRMIINESIVIIKNFFRITYVKNTGAAWSILDDKGYIVLVISGIIIIGIIRYVYKNKFYSLSERLSYSMILGGAIGNFLNRLIYGYVIDFVDINLFGYNWPIFNLADTFIVVGVIILAIYTWRCNHGNKSNG